MQLSFRLDKRPGESHLVLDGKKLLQGSAFAVDFAILRSHFWYPPDGPKNGTVKVIFF